MKKILLSIVLLLNTQNVAIAQTPVELLDSEFTLAVSQGYVICRLRDNKEAITEYINRLHVPSRVLDSRQILVQFQQVRWGARISCDVTLDEVEKEIKKNGRINTY